MLPRMSCFLCLLALLLGAGCSENAPVEGPSAYVSVPEFDAGIVVTDNLIDHRFVIENQGNSPLALMGVKTSCGCAAAIIQQGEVPPGKSGHVQVSFRPDGPAGVKTATAVVATNDPSRTNVILRLRCDFRPELYVTRDKLFLGRFPAGETAVAAGAFNIISGHELEPFEITAIDMSGAPGFVSTIETIRLGIDYQITVTNDQPLSPGPYSGLVIVKTDNHQHPEFMIAVDGAAAGPVEVQPAKVFLNHALDEKKTQDYILRVIPRTVDDFSVLHVSVPPGATVQMEAKAKHTVVRLLNMPADCVADGSFVTIQTDINGMEPLQVPIVVRGCSS